MAASFSARNGASAGPAQAIPPPTTARASSADLVPEPMRRASDIVPPSHRCGGPGRIVSPGGCRDDINSSLSHSAHGAAQLFDRVDLDLPHPLVRDGIFVRELVK